MTRAFLDTPICASPDEYFVGDPKSSASDNADGGTLALRDQATIECLDTVSVLRTYRKPRPGETWQTPLKSERRLLAQLDALIGLGNRALDQVCELAFDPDVPDPNRLFAAAFTLACASGTRWANAVRSLLLRASECTPAEMLAVTEALCLSPNRPLIESLRPLTDHGTWAVRAAVVRALGYHGLLPEGSWRRAIADPEAAVAKAAAKGFLHGYDREACKKALQPLLDTQDEKLLRLVLRAGLSLRWNAAHQCAVGLCVSDPLWADCLRCAAMFGFWPDVGRVQGLFETEHAPAALEAAGFLGYIDLAPALLAVLERSEEGSPAARHAARSFWMITGIFCETQEQMESTRRNWQQIFARYQSGARYRLGLPLSESLMVEQLRGDVFSRTLRQDIYRELLAATDYQALRFSPYDFVGAQRLSLANIGRDSLGAMS